ncbi:MAG: hypothetical protein FD163_137 [Hyphomonadaceae bacterium]|nr:MAG: hypothetical protein FD163_137 [Hyphomonadaceae bacterium]
MNFKSGPKPLNSAEGGKGDRPPESFSLPFASSEKSATFRRSLMRGARAGFAKQLAVSDKDIPFVLIKSIKGAKRISAVNLPAHKMGLAMGQSLTHARALFPDIKAIETQEKADEQDLTKLAHWMIRYSPHCAPYIFGIKYSILLDITGCEHLFGGEARLIADILQSLANFGISARIACAPNKGSAWALAFYDKRAKNGLSISSTELSQIDELPIEALRMNSKINDNLHALGLNKIGALAQIAPNALVRRFGSEVLQALNRTRGREAEAISPVREIIPNKITHPILHAILTWEGLEPAMQIAVKKLCQLLASKNQGAKTMRLCFYRVDGVVFEIKAAASLANNKPETWFMLLKERLDIEAEKMDLGFGVDLICAEAPLALNLQVQVVDLDPLSAAAIQSAEAVHRLAERLSARIGAKNIIRLKPQENWVPEQSQTKTSALDNEDENASIPEFIAKRRPPFLLKRPESIKAIAEVPDGPPRQFLFRSLSFKVKNFKGPERIIEPLLGKNPNAEMPTNSHKIRDYYQVETQNGARFFLFRAGFYGGETAPKWYVHGGG